MIIYWSMLLLIVLTALMTTQYQIKKYGDTLSTRKVKIHPIIPWIVFGYIIFFIGFRNMGGDTWLYIFSFNNLSTNQSISGILGNQNIKGPVFTILELLIKRYISNQYYFFLFFVAAVSGICIMKLLYKYSDYFFYSVFLFMCTGTVVWMMNGIRQFLAVCIIAAGFDWLLKGKTVKYILLILFASTIHNTAIIMIPIYFVIRCKPWSKKLILFILLTAVICMFMGQFTTILSDSLEATTYANAANELANGSGQGTNYLRVLVACIPTIFALMFRRKIEAKSDHKIDMLINLSVVTSCFSILGMFSNGILVGRMPIYFSIYNLILLPWIFNNVFKKRDGLLVKFICGILYLIYFYYQMVITWNMYYGSDFLRMSVHF
ncbi:MAG: EpsG family protein [Bacillota bacterium]|nr:EpsG family protein [Bacillota bacterium]